MDGYGFFVTLSLMFKGMQCVFMSRTGYNILAAYSMPALTLFSISCVALKQFPLTVLYFLGPTKNSVEWHLTWAECGPLRPTKTSAGNDFLHGPKSAHQDFCGMASYMGRMRPTTAD
jgi:hypothetical protein